MCLALLAVDCTERYRLVIAANRDEYHERDSAPAAFWPDRPALLAGRDRVAGGTWLGVTRAGRIALITNVHEPQRPRPANAPSRGQLPLDYLTGGDAAEPHLQRVAAGADRYAGFSLIAGNAAALHYLSNRGHGPHRLGQGLHGLGNRTLDSGEPKLAGSVADFGSLLLADRDPEEALFRLLGDDRPRGTDADTPDHPWREPLSAVFVRAPGYGTRCSTLLTVDRANRVRFVERRFDADGRPAGTTREAWRLGPDAA